jgi:hypothetical protein
MGSSEGLTATTVSGPVTGDGLVPNSSWDGAEAACLPISMDLEEAAPLAVLSNGVVGGEPATALPVPAGLAVTGALAFQGAAVAAWADFKSDLYLDCFYWPALVLQDQIAMPAQSIETQLDSAEPEVSNHRAVVDKVFAQLLGEMDNFSDCGDF